MAVRTIKADGTGDFETLDAWLASLPRVLQEDETARIDGVVEASSPQTLAGIKTRADRRLIVEAMPGQEFTGDGRRQREALATWRAGRRTGGFLRSGVDHLIVRGLFIDCRGFEPTPQNRLVRLPEHQLSEDSFIAFENCLIEGPASRKSAPRVQKRAANAGTFLLSNSVLIGWHVGGRVQLENCTLLGRADLGARSGDGIRHANARSCAVFGHAGEDNKDFKRLDYFGNEAVRSGSCAASDDSGSSAELRGLSAEDQYKDAARLDFTRKPGNALQGAGPDGFDIGYLLPGDSSAAPALEVPEVTTTVEGAPLGWQRVKVKVRSSSTDFTGHRIYVDGRHYADLPRRRSGICVEELKPGQEVSVTATSYYDGGTFPADESPRSAAATAKTTAVQPDFVIDAAALPQPLETIATATGEWSVRKAADDGEYVVYHWTVDTNPGWWALTAIRRPASDGASAHNRVDQPLKSIDWEGRLHAFRAFPGGMAIIQNGEAVAPEMRRVQEAIARGDVAPFAADAYAANNMEPEVPARLRPNRLQSRGYNPHRAFDRKSTYDRIFGGHSGATGGGSSSRNPLSLWDSYALYAAAAGDDGKWQSVLPVLDVQAKYALSLPNMLIWSQNHDQLRDPGNPLPGDRVFSTTGRERRDRYIIEPIKWTVDEDYAPHLLAEIGASAGQQASLSRDHEHWFNHGFVYWLATENPIYGLLFMGLWSANLAQRYSGCFRSGRYLARMGGYVSERATMNQFSALWFAHKVRERVETRSGHIFWDRARFDKMREDVFASHNEWTAGFLTSDNPEKRYNGYAYSVDLDGISPFMMTTYGGMTPYLWAVEAKVKGRPQYAGLMERLASHLVVKMHYGQGAAAWFPGGTSGMSMAAEYDFQACAGDSRPESAKNAAELPYDSPRALGAFWQKVGSSRGKSASSYDRGPAHSIAPALGILKQAEQLQAAGYLSPSNHLLADLPAAVATVERLCAATSWKKKTVSVKEMVGTFPQLPGAAESSPEPRSDAGSDAGRGDAPGAEPIILPPSAARPLPETVPVRCAVDTEVAGPGGGAPQDVGELEYRLFLGTGMNRAADARGTCTLPAGRFSLTLPEGIGIPGEEALLVLMNADRSRRSLGKVKLAEAV